MPGLHCMGPHGAGVGAVMGLWQQGGHRGHHEPGTGRVVSSARLAADAEGSAERGVTRAHAVSPSSADGGKGQRAGESCGMLPIPGGQRAWEPEGSWPGTRASLEAEQRGSCPQPGPCQGQPAARDSDKHARCRPGLPSAGTPTGTTTRSHHQHSMARLLQAGPWHCRGHSSGAEPTRVP